ncbi:hypothetical protein KIPB_001329 [Kipferlia bialata]|uniref:N-acetyltransferase domain-containing protein n=1 Tax=Kipferlia bialata TaxID=797122 RepID=A0A391NJF7_9EUKA|nr:hypothetical protein KIPB_001329 [Kipferlia bialata]|eukprot:g1329.t1
MRFCKASCEDVPLLRAFILDHGESEYNSLPPDAVDSELSLLSTGHADALCVYEGQGLLGFALLVRGEACPDCLAQYDDLKGMCYAAEVVVSRQCTGRGLGTRLLSLCVEEARDKGYRSVYIWRHEDNAPSAGMMRKAGFRMVDTVYDPHTRKTGSRRTTIMNRTVH